MATPFIDLESYLESKGRAWSGGRYIVPDQGARHVRAQGIGGLADEFHADAAQLPSVVVPHSRRQLRGVAASALDLASPELADASRLVARGLQLASTTLRPRSPRRSPW